MERYFPSSVEFRSKYFNPFRVDSKRGCYFAYSSKGNLIFFDNSFPEYGGDCFKIAMLGLGKDFRNTLVQINNDFGLELKTSSRVTPLRADYIQKIKGKKNTLSEKDKQVLKAKDKLKLQRFHYKVKTRKWLQIDYDYWTKRFGISLNLLMRYKIYPVNSYFKRKWDRITFQESYNFQGNPSNPCYCYQFECKGIIAVKIYKPLTINKAEKWESNIKDCNVQGYDQLPATGNLLVIASSMKDLLVLVANGINAIAPQGEGMDIPGYIMNDIKKRFKKIVYCYDRDTAGKRWSKRYSELHDLKYKMLPKLETDVEDKLKDFAEYKEHLGVEFKTFVNNLFNTPISNGNSGKGKRRELKGISLC